MNILNHCSVCHVEHLLTTE